VKRFGEIKMTAGFGIQDYFMFKQVPYECFKGRHSAGFQINFVISGAHNPYLSGYLSGWSLLHGFYLPLP
jgi:ribosomal protein L5